MKEVFLVSDDNRGKAELLLKQDEAINRGSILLRAASALGINEKGYFIILDASEPAMAKAKELLKGIAEIYKAKDKVIKAYDEQENAALEGFGNILG